MRSPIRSSIGILPAGALGVSFYYHLTRKLTQPSDSIFFLERESSQSSQAIRRGGGLLVFDEVGTEASRTTPLLREGLESCAREGTLPELLLLCPNPDQLLPSLTSCVRVLERAHSEGTLRVEDLPLPVLVLCSNGIYFQRIRQVFLEKLEEATLMGRLPDLWPDLMPSIVAKLLRGVTIQTGIREGHGAEAVYRPGPPGLTRIAGGDPVNRQRAFTLLSANGMRVEIAENTTPTRVEFDKAMVNLVANLLGQLTAIQEDGRFQLVTIGDVLSAMGTERIRGLGQRVVEVGRAVRAYGQQEPEGPILDAVIANLQEHAAHIPSSVQWLDLSLRKGERIQDISPTELWLLDPLLHYARSAELHEAVRYFEQLKKDVQTKLKACHAFPKSPLP